MNFPRSVAGKMAFSGSTTKVLLQRLRVDSIINATDALLRVSLNGQAGWASALAKRATKQIRNPNKFRSKDEKQTIQSRFC